MFIKTKETMLNVTHMRELGVSSGRGFSNNRWCIGFIDMDGNWEELTDELPSEEFAVKLLDAIYKNIRDGVAAITLEELFDEA